MEYKIKQDQIEHAFEVIDDLDHLLTERISDLHEVKGGKQSRHAYIFYRSKLWDIRYILKENLKEIKPESE